jgi:dihydroneopterin aldolase/2-amino-4-hydroxy-6-hydroxymethyldihydropteridine diphosphokinase/dihydropteroate synthase
MFTITRCLADYAKEHVEQEATSTLVPPLKGPSPLTNPSHTSQYLGLGKTVTAYIAIGTNLGDRIQNIQDALAAVPRIAEDCLGGEVEGQRVLQVTRCSQLYESAPMYVLDQPEFVNGAIQVSRLHWDRGREC